MYSETAVTQVASRTHGRPGDEEPRRPACWSTGRTGSWSSGTGCAGAGGHPPRGVEASTHGVARAANRRATSELLPGGAAAPQEWSTNNEVTSPDGLAAQTRPRCNRLGGGSGDERTRAGFTEWRSSAKHAAAVVSRHAHRNEPSGVRHPEDRQGKRTDPSSRLGGGPEPDEKPGGDRGLVRDEPDERGVGASVPAPQQAGDDVPPPGATEEATPAPSGRFGGSEESASRTRRGRETGATSETTATAVLRHCPRSGRPPERRPGERRRVPAGPVQPLRRRQGDSRQESPRSED